MEACSFACPTFDNRITTGSGIETLTSDGKVVRCPPCQGTKLTGTTMQESNPALPTLILGPVSAVNSSRSPKTRLMGDVSPLEAS